ncbi:MAG TPA: hypothetical protein PK843_17445 [bacterium]|nr:hypothetical protein [bacterium]
MKIKQAVKNALFYPNGSTGSLTKVPFTDLLHNPFHVDQFFTSRRDDRLATGELVRARRANPGRSEQAQQYGSPVYLAPFGPLRREGYKHSLPLSVGCWAISPLCLTRTFIRGREQVIYKRTSDLAPGPICIDMVPPSSRFGEHLSIFFNISKRLFIFFRYDRCLLGTLCRSKNEAMRDG